MPDFLILALPRSRTAWLANFMTDSGIFCYHEAINGCKSMDEYLIKTEGCGDSDTALAMFNYKKHMDVPTVIIDTSIDNAVNFGIDQGFDIRDSMISEKYNLDAIDGLHVNIHDIDQRLEEIWLYLTDKKFNRKRAEMLTKLDIQVKNINDIDIDALSEFMNNEF